MANWADVRAGLAAWFKIPDYQAEALLSRVTPTLDIMEVIEEGAESGGLPAPRDCWHSDVQVAVGAAMSRIQLMNPANSGVTIRVWKISIWKTASGLIRVGFVNTALATGGVNRYMDQRIGISPETFLVKHPAGSVTHDTNAATGILGADSIERTRVLNQITVMDFDRRLILPPGFGVRIVNETVNEQLNCTFYTTEVPQRSI